MADDAGPSKVPTSLPVAGAWTGLIEVLLDEWTVKGLREEVSRRSGFSVPSVNMIALGRTLKDLNEGEVSPLTLRGVGFKENTTLWITRVGATNLENADKYEKFLCRMTEAASAVAKRTSRGEFRKLSGDQSMVPSADRKALVAGLTLHEVGRGLLKFHRYQDALGVLALAEDALSQCSAAVLEDIRNPAQLQLDKFWCLFLLHDISRLRAGLPRVREIFNHAHGSWLTSLPVLQGGFCPDLALHLRLQLLESVVSFHDGKLATARESLKSAREIYKQFQISENDLDFLTQKMGFPRVDSRRALRMSGHDVHEAVDFLTEERDFGRTPRGKPVKAKWIFKLVDRGYEKRVAAEALRVTENSIEQAVVLLSNAGSLSTLNASLAASTAIRQAVESVAPARILLTGIGRIFKSSEATCETIEQKLGAEERASEWEDEMQGALEKRFEALFVSSPDHLKDYDVEVEKEGDAIKAYLALLDGL